MRPFSRLLRVGFVTITLAACSFGGTTVDEAREETARGVIEPAGISIYQEGTHRLVFEDERFMLLESSQVNLNRYIGQDVEVTGMVRETTEAGGEIMRVDSIAQISASSSSSASSEMSSASSDASMSSTSAAALSSTATSRAAASSVARSSAAAASSIAMSASSVDAADPLQARAATMAKADVSGASWTQQYCSTHIAFCMPVHRNWWFKSFGATASYRWHVEMSSEEILTIGDGPIAVNLVSGSLASIGATDGEVRTDGDSVMGLRAWGENEHFEITAPASLRSAVQYITSNLSKSASSSSSL